MAQKTQSRSLCKITHNYLLIGDEFFISWNSTKLAPLNLS